jgi:hypothetical protein
VLAKDFAVISGRFQRLEAAFDAHVLTQHGRAHDRLRYWHALEGLLSVTWQSWSGFCRSVALKSCTGTITRSGLATVPIADVTDAGRLAYIAKALSRNDAVKAGKSLAAHQEPTWGDTSLVLDAVRYLKPTNLASLESGLLTAARAPADIRVIRNAAAHINSSNMLDVDRLKIYYVGTKFAHPTDILTWRARGGSEYVYTVWIAELLSIADAMTS